MRNRPASLGHPWAPPGGAGRPPLTWRRRRPRRAGMPYPQNLETALEVEAAVRSGGAVPATIAVIAGVCCVGAPGGPGGAHCMVALHSLCRTA